MTKTDSVPTKKRLPKDSLFLISMDNGLLFQELGELTGGGITLAGF